MKTQLKTKVLGLMLVIALVASMSIGLTACNNDNDAQHSDVLIVGSTMEIKTLNRLDADGGAPGYSYDVLAASLTQLTPVYSGNGQYYPQLCNFTTSSDGLTWAFGVKSGYTWHDGTAVTNEDVLYTFQQSLSSDKYQSLAIQDGKVSITLAAANPRFLGDIASIRIYPKHIMETVTAETITDAQSVVGCGPFKFAERNIQNNTITFTKYTAYPDAAKISFNTVIVKFYGSDDVMHLALKNGEIDMEYTYSSGLTADAQASFANNNNITLQSYASKRMPKTLFFNNAVVTNANVKKAIQKAINYDAIRISFGSPNSTAPKEGFISPAIYGYTPTADLTRDLNGARELLAKEGYSSTNRFQFELLVNSGNDDSQYASLLKTALEETGMIDVTINSKASADRQSYYKAGSHTAALSAITAAGFEMCAGLATKYFLPLNSEVLNENPVCYGNYSLRDSDGNLTEFGTIYTALATAVNNEEYLAGARTLQEFIVANTPAISLLNDTMTQAYSNKLTGFTVDDNYGLFNINGFSTLRKAAK